MAHAAAKLSNLFNAALPTNVSLNYDMKYYPFDLYFRLFISIKKKKKKFLAEFIFHQKVNIILIHFIHHHLVLVSKCFLSHTSDHSYSGPPQESTEKIIKHNLHLVLQDSFTSPEPYV